MSAEPWPHYKWEIPVHPVRCMSCPKVVRGLDVEGFRSLVASGVSREEALNILGYVRPCCRTAMLAPAVTQLTSVVDEEIVRGRKDLRLAVIPEVAPMPKFTPTRSPAKAGRVFEFRAGESAPRAARDAATAAAIAKFNAEVPDPEVRNRAIHRWLRETLDADEEALAAAVAAAGGAAALNRGDDEDRRPTPVWEPGETLGSEPGIPLFPVGISNDTTLELRPVGMNRSVRVIKARSFAAL